MREFYALSKRHSAGGPGWYEMRRWRWRPKWGNPLADGLFINRKMAGEKEARPHPGLPHPGEGTVVPASFANDAAGAREAFVG